MPLSQQKARNDFKTSKAVEQQQTLRVRAAEQNTLIQIENDVANAQSDFERVAATRQATLYAEAALEAEQKKLENGKSTSFNVLFLQRDLTQARSAEIQALTDYNRALSQLSLKEGNTLERNGLKVDIR